MKTITIAIIFFCTISLNKQDCNTITLKKQAERLTFLYESSLKAFKENQRMKLEKEFIDCFPNSYGRFDSLYEYHPNDSILGCLLDYSDMHIDLLFSSNSISLNERFKKIVNISIGAQWNADATGYFQHNLQRYTSLHINIIFELINRYNNKDIKSFWHFYFDGPCPENYKDDFNDLYSRCIAINPKIAGIMKKAYEQLLLEHKGHGR